MCQGGLALEKDNKELRTLRDQVRDSESVCLCVSVSFCVFLALALSLARARALSLDNNTEELSTLRDQVRACGCVFVRVCGCASFFVSVCVCVCVCFSVRGLFVLYLTIEFIHGGNTRACLYICRCYICSACAQETFTNTHR